MIIVQKDFCEFLILNFHGSVMPLWEGIEDATDKPEPIWFTRLESQGDWIPLRNIDCKHLNDPIHCSNQDGLVFVDGGRATVDLSKKHLKYNFYKQDAIQEVCSAFWFYRDGESMVPCKGDCDKIEQLYQSALRIPDDDEELLSSLVNEEVALTSIVKGNQNNTQYVAFVSYDSSSKFVAIKKRPASNQLLSLVEPPTLLQRGFGEYNVDGELEECTLGPVKHLIFVVHGIGEALWSQQDNSLIEEMNICRTAMYKRQVDLWKKECIKAEKEKCPSPAPPSRIELLPIQWYDRIHSPSTSLKSTLNSVTLTSVPAIRQIANDVVFDVLMYMTPEFCQDVLEFVTEKISDLYSKFKVIHEHFETSGGRCSLIGHSLGSVIVWDLLALLKSQQEKDTSPNVLDTLSNTYKPITKSEIRTVIPFEPEFTFLLGSPVGLFLTLRGANNLFEKLRLNTSNDAQVSPFSLPSGAIFNIFHSSDPVAYRIEPLLLPPKSDAPPPVLLVTKEGGMRPHLALRQLGEELQKILQEGKAKIENFLPHTPNQMSEPKEIKFALSGKNNARVDYMIQTELVENEYVSAVSAHSMYFRNDDILDFIIQKGTEG